MELARPKYLAFVYGLIDPRTKEYRYVGMSKNPQNRFIGHLKEARNSKKKNHKIYWIRGLVNLGLTFETKILSKLSSSPGILERQWIKKLRFEGNRLTNKTAGGEGLLNPSPATRKLLSKSISAGITKAWSDPTYRAKQIKARSNQRKKTSESVRNLWKDPEYRKRQLLSRSKSKSKRWEDPDARKRQSEALKKAHQDPKVYARKVAAVRRTALNTEVQRKKSESQIKRWKDPVYAAKIKSSMNNRDSHGRIQKVTSMT